MCSLEGYRSTIELLPRIFRAYNNIEEVRCQDLCVNEKVAGPCQDRREKARTRCPTTHSLERMH